MEEKDLLGESGFLDINKMGIVIESKDVLFWKEVKSRAEEQIEMIEKSLKLQKAVKDMAEAKLQQDASK